MTQPSNIELTEICNRIDFLRKIISLSSSSVIDKYHVTVAKKQYVSKTRAQRFYQG